MSFTSLRSKLAASFVLGAAMLTVLGVTSLSLLKTVNGVASEIRTLWLPKVEHLAQIRGIIHQHQLLATKTVTSGQHRFLMALIQSVEATGVALRGEEQQAHDKATTWQEKLLVTQLYDDWKAYEDSFAPILAHLDSGELNKASDLYKSNALHALRQTIEKFNRLTTLSDAGSADAVRRGETVYQLAWTLTIGLVALTLLLASGAVLWVGHRISRPILQVSDAMTALARGELDIPTTQGCQRNDEIGTLFKAVTGYRDALVRSSQLAEIADHERRRLQAAVSNLPLGFAMFDQDKRLIVCNATYREMYSVPEELAKTGVPLRALLDHRIASGNFEGSRETYVDRLMQIVARKEPSARQVELADGRVISISQMPVEGVGWIATHEDVSERVRTAHLITHMARHDALTGLPNRMLFMQGLESALGRVANGETVAVLYLDLDRFKAVNDTLGHAVGDVLLKIVAERLQSTIRSSDIVARLGGDEFAIIQSESPQPDSARALADRIVEYVSQPYAIDGHDIAIGTSVGIAMAPVDGVTAETLLKRADLALYGSKQSGRGQVRFFQPVMDQAAEDRRRLELDLRAAIATGHLDVHYQPIVAADTNSIVSFEALVRWTHPERGSIPPHVFIPLAEHTGLIGPLGQWVLEQACRDAVAWPEAVTVAVNVSPAQFTSAKLIQIVKDALEGASLPAHRLELEITEDLLLSGREVALAVLQQLRALGVRIAMDDFGCGYSSLNYLRSFEFDTIKIDRSFVQSISTDRACLAIVRAVVHLSRELGAVTIAEGVETHEQLDAVRSEGCTRVQGFFFSPAVSADEVMMFLESATPSGAVHASVAVPTPQIAMRPG